MYSFKNEKNKKKLVNNNLGNVIKNKSTGNLQTYSKTLTESKERLDSYLKYLPRALKQAKQKTETPKVYESVDISKLANADTQSQSSEVYRMNSLRLNRPKIPKIDLADRNRLIKHQMKSMRSISYKNNSDNQTIDIDQDQPYDNPKDSLNNTNFMKKFTNQFKEESILNELKNSNNINENDKESYRDNVTDAHHQGKDSSNPNENHAKGNYYVFDYQKEKDTVRSITSADNVLASYKNAEGLNPQIQNNSVYSRELLKEKQLEKLIDKRTAEHILENHKKDELKIKDTLQRISSHSFYTSLKKINLNHKLQVLSQTYREVERGAELKPGREVDYDEIFDSNVNLLTDHEKKQYDDRIKDKFNATIANINKFYLKVDQKVQKVEKDTIYKKTIGNVQKFQLNIINIWDTANTTDKTYTRNMFKIFYRSNRHKENAKDYEGPYNTLFMDISRLRPLNLSDFNNLSIRPPTPYFREQSKLMFDLVKCSSFNQMVKEFKEIIKRSDSDINQLVRLLEWDRLLVYDHDHYGFTLLHHCCKRNLLRLAYNLVTRYHVLLNPQDNFGKTPLFYAVKGGFVELTKMLVYFGASLFTNMEEYHECITYYLTNESDEIRQFIAKYLGYAVTSWKKESKKKYGDLNREKKKHKENDAQHSNATLNDKQKEKKDVERHKKESMIDRYGWIYKYDIWAKYKVGLYDISKFYGSEFDYIYYNN